jgi:hypothetical protein
MHSVAMNKYNKQAINKKTKTHIETNVSLNQQNADVPMRRSQALFGEESSLCAQLRNSLFFSYPRLT